MDDETRREEEARREAEERRRINPRIDDEGRRREEPAFDDQRYDDRYYDERPYEGREGRTGREGRSGREIRSAREGRSEREGRYGREDRSGRESSSGREGSSGGRGSQIGGRLSEAAGRISERVSERVSGRGGRSGGTSRGQTSGLYGSQIDASTIMNSAIAELVGTFILVFTGTAVATAAILQRPTAGPAIYDSLAVALAFGLALTAVVAAIGHVSGAHVNPAVTLGLAATNKFPWEYVPIYIGAQLIGGILGAIGTWIAYGELAREVADLAATFPAENVGDLQALLVEILVTFILVFVVISVATDDRAPAGVAPLAVGFALACGVFIAGPVTGGSLNPARTLGPMILAFDFAAVWVYIVGPIIGAVLAALLYDRFASRSDASG